MRVLLTGHNGYIGSVMGTFLSQAGHDVTGLDIGYFAETDFVQGRHEAEFPLVDIRDLTDGAALKGFEAIVHLAALSNDPVGNLHLNWTREINSDGTVKLAELARKAGVSRFLFRPHASCTARHSWTMSMRRLLSIPRLNMLDRR